MMSTMAALRLGLPGAVVTVAVVTVAVVTVAGLVAGCGSGGVGARSGQQATVARGGVRSDPAAVSVIRAWARALRRGDVRAAARYFALPSVFANGVQGNGEVPVIVIRTERQAEQVNESLPCGALLISAAQDGPYVNVRIRLTARAGPGAGCGAGTGQVASTNFVVKGGLIVQWIRAPDDSGRGTPTIPTLPSSQPGTGPVV
jgi:hypothetical protein